jgi:hypothetical protein
MPAPAAIDFVALIYTLADLCADAWRWQSGNPDGYAQM